MDAPIYNPPPLLDLLEDVCATQNIPVSSVISPTRTKDIKTTRHIFCYVACFYTKYTCELIGQTIGNRDHTTVINSRDVVKNMLDTNDAEFMEKWKQFKLSSKYFSNLFI